MGREARTGSTISDLPSEFEFVELDALGEFIWSQTTAPTDIDLIVRAVTSRFEVDPETCRADVTRFLQELHDAQLIELD